MYGIVYCIALYLPVDCRTRWDIAVKISEQLYKILWRITTLSSAFIRLPEPFPPQSFYEPAPQRITAQAIGLPMLSGFKRLQSLDIHNINSREAIPEIRACIQNLSGVLKCLRLSMSRHTWKHVKAAVGDDDTDTTFSETTPATQLVWEYVTALTKVLGLKEPDDDPAKEAYLQGQAETAAGTTPGDSEAVTVASSDANEAQGSLAQAAASTSHLPTESPMDGTDIRRGLTLHTLGLEKMIVNASVLSRGIDLAALQSITLLDIGSQVPVWELFARVNKTQPLALSSIHTNDVSKPFLRFVSQLPKLSHIYLVHSTYAREDNEQGERKCSLRDIRRYILKKHGATLQTISVHGRREDIHWYMDMTTLVMLAQRCQQLEELAVSMSIDNYGTFLNVLPQFTKLVALRISHLEGEYAARVSLLGVLDHNPQLALEYMNLNDLDIGFVDIITRHDARQHMLQRMEREAKYSRAIHGSDDESGDGDDSSDDGSLGFEYSGPEYVFETGIIYFAETNTRIFSREIVNASFCW